MRCESCRSGFLECFCPDLDRKIALFLESAEGRKLSNGEHNRLVQRAAAVIDRRVAANECEFIQRFKDLRIRPYRRRKLWTPTTIKKS